VVQVTLAVAVNTVLRAVTEMLLAVLLVVRAVSKVKTH
jgi:hypothetical protein